MAGELKMVRELIRNPRHLSPQISAMIDGERLAWHKEAKEKYRLDPASEKYEVTCLALGSIAGRILANPNVWEMLVNVELSAAQEAECLDEADRIAMLGTLRGGLFSSFLWALTISPHANR